MTKASVSKFAKFAAKQTAIADTLKQMETAAQSKNFVQALERMAALSKHVDEHLIALEQLEKQQKAYQDALALLEPRLPNTSQRNTKRSRKLEEKSIL